MTYSWQWRTKMPTAGQRAILINEFTAAQLGNSGHLGPHALQQDVAAPQIAVHQLQHQQT